MGGCFDAARNHCESLEDLFNGRRFGDSCRDDSRRVTTCNVPMSVFLPSKTSLFRRTPKSLSGAVRLTLTLENVLSTLTMTTRLNEMTHATISSFSGTMRTAFATAILRK